MAESTNPHYRQLERNLDSSLASLDRLPGAPETRGLALAAAATAAGRRDVTRAALKVALARGADPGRLREAVLQTYLFAGYPRAINALAELAVLLPEPEPAPALDLDAELGDDRSWRERGEALCRRVYGPHYEGLLRTMGRISTDLGRWMVVEGYGKVLSRPRLDAPVRELVAVAALMVLDVPDQLRAHLRGALLVGVPRGELEAVLDAAALVDPEARRPAAALLERVTDLRGEAG